MVHEVKDKADFQSQLKAAGDKLVVVDFFATWQVTLRNPNLTPDLIRKELTLLKHNYEIYILSSTEMQKK